VHRVGIAWQIGSGFGWGVYGYHIARRLIATGTAMPMLLEPAGALEIDPLEQAQIAPVLKEMGGVQQRVRQSTLQPFPMRIPVLHACGNDAAPAFSALGANVRGRPNHALAFLESSRLDRTTVERFTSYDRVIAGSTWNGHLLVSAGIGNVAVSLQGVDQTMFHPAPRNGRFGDRFVIFSGGKLEYRKGQDIVLASVAAFRQRHPETLLFAVWGNPWPDSPQSRLFAQSPHVDGPPPLSAAGHADLGPWFTRHGIPIDAACVLSRLPQYQLARLLREADVALFPNRCEGGTNLMAMEAMASGVPTILATNTGHLDIMVEGACYPLNSQRPIASPSPRLGMTGWGESSVDEIVEMLELVWSDRETAREVGRRGAEYMAAHTWDARVDGLIELLGLAGP
jgi:glycosyltransferase involved in cell wall biosynthesis